MSLRSMPGMNFLGLCECTDRFATRGFTRAPITSLLEARVSVIALPLRYFSAFALSGVW